MSGTMQHKRASLHLSELKDAAMAAVTGGHSHHGSNGGGGSGGVGGVGGVGVGGGGGHSSLPHQHSSVGSSSGGFGGAIRRASFTARRRTSASSVSSVSSVTTTASAAAAASASAGTGGCFAKTFPEKLMDMLETSADRNGPHYNESISWLPHGKSFAISDPDKFTLEVLPRYFKQSKFKSFTRKLYRWGFRQITKGGDAGSYYHEQFRRGDFEGCGNMRCHYSEKELRNQQENAAVAAGRRSRSSGAAYENAVRRVSGGAGQAVRRASGQAKRRSSGGVGRRDSKSQQAIRRHSATARLSQARRQSGGGGQPPLQPERRLSIDEDDDEAVMAQIEAAAATFGGIAEAASPPPQAPGVRRTSHASIGSVGERMGRLTTQDGMQAQAQQPQQPQQPHGGRSSLRSSFNSDYMGAGDEVPPPSPLGPAGGMKGGMMSPGGVPSSIEMMGAPATPGPPGPPQGAAPHRRHHESPSRIMSAEAQAQAALLQHQRSLLGSEPDYASGGGGAAAEAALLQHQRSLLGSEPDYASGGGSLTGAAAAMPGGHSAVSSLDPGGIASVGAESAQAILERHRMEDAILARQEEDLRRRRRELEIKIAESKRRAEELQQQAAAHRARGDGAGGGVAGSTDASPFNNVAGAARHRQQGLGDRRGANDAAGQVARLQMLECLAAERAMAAAGDSGGAAAADDPDTLARLREVEAELGLGLGGGNEPNAPRGGRPTPMPSQPQQPPPTQQEIMLARALRERQMQRAAAASLHQQQGGYGGGHM